MLHSHMLYSHMSIAIFDLYKTQRPENLQVIRITVAVVRNRFTIMLLAGIQKGGSIQHFSNKAQ